MEKSFRLAPFVRFLIPLCLGILFGRGVQFIDSRINLLLLVSVFLFFIGVVIANKKHHRPLFPIILGLTSNFFLLLFGSFIANQYDYSKRDDFIGNFPSTDAYTGIISSDIQLTTKSAKCILDVWQVRQNAIWYPVKGKVLVYMDTAFARANCISYGDELLVTGFPTVTSPPMNPGEFNFKKYLSYSNIFHRDYINVQKAIKIGEHKGKAITKIAVSARDFAGEIIRRFIHSPREASILSALVLGIRGEIR